MKVLVNLVVMLFIALSLSGCLSNHIGYTCEGKSKDEVMKKFGAPEEVKKSVKDHETWKYPMGDGVKSYTFKRNTCISQDSHRR